MKNKDTSYSYIHFWNPDNYLKAFVIIGALIISAIISFIEENGTLISILYFIGEIGISFYFYLKWKKEYKTKEYTEHKKLKTRIWLILIVLAIVGIFLFYTGIDTYFWSKAGMQEELEYIAKYEHMELYDTMYFFYQGYYYKAISAWIFAVAWFYPLIWGIIYRKFYQKYEKDMQVANNEK